MKPNIILSVWVLFSLFIFGNAQTPKGSQSTQKKSPTVVKAVPKPSYTHIFDQQEKVYYLVDEKTGNRIKKLPYKHIYNFKGGFARVEVENKSPFIIEGHQPTYLTLGFISLDYKEITLIKYDKVKDFSDGIAVVGLSGKFGYIDKTGKEITQIIFDEANDCKEGRALVKVNGKYGFLDNKGSEVVPIKYDYAKNYSEGLAAVRLKMAGYIDKNGNEAISLKYQNANSFSGGVAGVMLNDKMSIINKEGKELIPYKYDRIDEFIDGIAIMKYSDHYGLINTKGEEIAAPEYYFIQPFYFNKEFTVVKKFFSSRNYGLINKKGKLVVPCKYDEVEGYFQEGMMIVKIDGKYGYVDSSGKEVIPTIFNKATNFVNGIAVVHKDGTPRYIDKRGQLVSQVDPETAKVFKYIMEPDKKESAPQNDKPFVGLNNFTISDKGQAIGDYKFRYLFTYQNAKSDCPIGYRIPTVDDWVSLMKKIMTDRGFQDSKAYMVVNHIGLGWDETYYEEKVLNTQKYVIKSKNDYNLNISPYKSHLNAESTQYDRRDEIIYWVQPGTYKGKNVNAIEFSVEGFEFRQLPTDWRACVRYVKY